jgi:hypothetical protein
MRILSRTLITVLVLLGVAFVLMLSFSSCQHEGNYAGGQAGCGAYPFKFGCESPLDPFPEDSAKVEAWLKDQGVSKECYKIHFWHKNNTGPWQFRKEIGTLAPIQCFTKKGPPKMTATSGSGGTQRVMFNSPTTRDAFESYIKK